MKRQQVTKPVPEGAERRTAKDGGVEVRVQVRGRWQWCPVNENGRYRFETGPYRGVITNAAGKREVISLTFDKSSSAAMLADKQREASRIRAGIDIPESSAAKLPVADLVALYRKERLSRLVPRAAMNAEASLRDFLAFAKPATGADLGRITGSDITAWRAGMRPDYAEQTLHNKSAAVRTFLKWLKDQDVIQRVPTFPKAPKGNRENRRAVTLEEMKLVCKHAPASMVPLIKLAFYSLARRGTLFTLKASDIGFKGGLSIHIRPESDKMKQGRLVPLPRFLTPMMRALVKKYPAGFLFSDLSPDNLSREFAAIGVKAGIPEKTEEGTFTFHGLRHGGASFLHRKGIDLLLIARLGGWRDVQMLFKRYSHVKPIDCRAAIDGAWDS